MENFSWEKSFIEIFEIFRPFVKTLNPEKYFLCKRQKLMQPIQMQLSKKLMVLSQVFTAFLRFTFNFKHFKKEDGSHSLCLSEIIDCEIRAYVTVSKVMFQ